MEKNKVLKEEKTNEEERWSIFKMNEKDKKLLFFFGGVILAGISLNNYNQSPILAFAGIMIGAYFIIRAFD